jgi:hypothetical protein
MRKLIKRILLVLDGTPTVYGHYSRGQSMLELALITPILIILLMGLAEIGWFANNYLILLETTRTGARFGTTQAGDRAPAAWPNAASLYPATIVSPPASTDAQNFRTCANLADERFNRFFNGIACRMLDTMEPLDFRDRINANNPNSIDDIVVSAFSILSVNPSSSSDIPADFRSALALVSGYPTTAQQLIVVGRYPSNANECTTDPAETRDPFNYINTTTRLDGGRNYTLINTALPDTADNRNYVEYTGFDSTPELQRGFSFAGQHRILATRTLPPDQQCIGSEWTINRVQQLINLANFGLTNQQRANLPSQGMVLVEMFWRHSLLLRNPVFNPVFTILNDPTIDPSAPNDAGTIISVWAAFPLPQLEPRNITFR